MIHNIYEEVTNKIEEIKHKQYGDVLVQIADHKVTFIIATEKVRITEEQT